MMCPIFNSIDIEYSYQEKKYVRTQSPARLERGKYGPYTGSCGDLL